MHIANLVRKEAKMSTYENYDRVKMLHAELRASRARRAHQRVVKKYKKIANAMITISIMAFTIMFLLPVDMIGGAEYETLAMGVCLFATPMLAAGLVMRDHSRRGDYDHEDFMYRRH